MSVRVRYRLEIAISSTSAEEKDLANSVFEVVTDELGEGGVRKFTIAASSTDVAINLGNVTTTTFLAIRTNTKDPTEDPVTISVKRNGTGNEAIAIAPLADTKEGHLLISTAGLTSLHATNVGSVDMELSLFSAGD